MNAGVPNQGMRCLRELVAGFGDSLEVSEFDVRADGALPDVSHDIYLSSGGPGSPLASNEIWEREYFRLLDELWAHNRATDDPAAKKYVFFICHSFQLACRYFGAGSITARRSKSFGTFPVHRSNAGDRDVLFEGLDDPFTAADFRDYQVVRPSYVSLGGIGGSVLAFEKLRPHVPYERAVMAIRFSPEWVGTQFHPEADASGMTQHFGDEERRAVILDEFGAEKYAQMMADLADPAKIERTHATVIPGFIRRALNNLAPAEATA